VLEYALERKPEPLPEKTDAVAIPAAVESTEVVSAVKH
jgi:hypothetical protein